MGKGKGDIVEWSVPIKKGLIFFKLTLFNPILIKSVIDFFKSKLPFRIKYTFSKHLISELSSKTFNAKIKKLPTFETKLKKK
jgi:ribosomal protein L16/L10AE